MLEEADLIQKIKIVEDITPCNFIIHRLSDMNIIYLSRMAKRNIGIPEEVENSLSFLEYFTDFFDFEAEKDRIEELFVRLETMKDDDFFTYFQHVRTQHAQKDFDCFVSSTKVFYRDAKGNPTYILTMALPMLKENSDSTKVNRLLIEKKNFREKWEIFDELTRREKQILQRMARNETSLQIATELYISENTVLTHRRNIKRKIQAKTDFDVISFAQVFDLI